MIFTFAVNLGNISINNIYHTIGSERFKLLPEKAMFWENEEALVLADLHLGKVTHFRKNGIAVPSNVEMENYERLSTLILQYNPKSVLILGDLFHSEHNSQWSAFTKFLTHFSEIQFHLIMGNHDILNYENYDLTNLKLHQESLEWKSIRMTHHPEKTEGYYNLCGHIHPGIKLGGKGKQTLRLPCFYFNDYQGILPAFGAFTGLYIIDITSNDVVYGIVEDSVIELG